MQEEEHSNSIQTDSGVITGWVMKPWTLYLSHFLYTDFLPAVHNPKRLSKPSRLPVYDLIVH